MSHDLVENRYSVFPIKILILDIIRNTYFSPVNVLIYYYHILVRDIKFMFNNQILVTQ